MATSDSTTKRCPRCDLVKAKTEFGRRGADRNFAPKAYCKICEREVERLRHPPKPRLPEGLRRCSKCDQILPETHEYFAKRGHRKFRSICRECERKKRREDHARNPEKRRAQQRQWRLNNPEKAQAKKKRDYDKRRDVIIQTTREWRKKYPEKVRAAQKNWDAAHKEERRALKRKHKAKRKNAPGHHTAKDIAVQFQSQDGLCWWCGNLLDPNDYHVDHRIALARGGTNNANNLCISCPHCNMSKNDRMPWEWSDRLL